MRLTAPLGTKMLKRLIKDTWKRKGVLKIPPTVGQKTVLSRGVELEDWSRGKPKPPPKRWEPPVKDDPMRWSHPSPEELPNWQEEPAYTVSGYSRLIEGEKQACILSKSQLFDGMPEGVRKLVGAVELPDQDRLVQQCVMLSQEWNPTWSKLPKRFDREKIGWHFNREYGIPQNVSQEIFMRSLLLKCQSLSGRFPSLLRHRRTIRRPYLGTHFYFRGEKLINIQGHMNWLVSGDQPLPIFGTEELVDSSVGHTLPDIWPIAPTNSIVHNHNYVIQNTTGFSEAVVHHHPHVVLLSSRSKWKPYQRNALGILFSFGYCMAQARQRFGENVTTLPEPVCVQLVHMSHNQFDFICFQLNTLNLSSEDGVKNFVWVDSDNLMYRKHLPQPWKGPEYTVKRYTDYEPEVFRKLLATFLYGVPNLNINSILDDQTDTRDVESQAASV